MAEVAVIGAGVGGLASAIDLAAAGHSVTVFEAMEEVGGKLGRVVIDGVEADTGPSVLTMPEVFEQIFAAAGTSLADEVTLVAHDALMDVRWADGARLTLHREPEASLASIEETFGARAASEFGAFLNYAGGIWAEAAPAFVFGDAPSFGTALSIGLRRPLALRKIDPMRSMLSGIEAHVSEPHLRDVLARYATYNGSDPRFAPATLNCIAHVELSGGCYGVQGGMYELARALERVALRLGVEFRLAARVERVHSTTLETSTGPHRADAIVVNADVAHLFSDLLSDRAYEPPPPSMSGWTALVRTPRRERLAHSVAFGERYLAEFEDIFDRGVAPRDPTVYVCAQEVAHDRRGDDDHELLFCMANAPATSADRGTDVGALRDRVLGTLRAQDWITPDATVVWERSPQQLAAQFPGTHGAIYGGSSNSRFAAFQRPSNRVPGHRGLYLASGSAHPGGGVPLCALSGRAAARALTADFPLRASRQSG